MTLLERDEWPQSLVFAVEKLEKAGAILEFRLFHLENDEPDLSAHQKAAIAALESVRAAIHPPIEFRMTLAPEKLALERAEKWTSERFFGPFFDLETRKLMVRGSNPRFPFRLHPFDEPKGEIWRDLRDFPVCESVTQGFADALLEPPHGFGKWSVVEKNSVLSLLCDELFGSLKPLEVWSWPLDCSNFFEAGLEWWGAFFWTVWAPEKRWIAAILASSTD